VKKYLIIDKQGEREMNEEEYSDFLFENLLNHFYGNIETTYKKIKIHSTFKNYGKYYSRRSKPVGKCQVYDCTETPIWSHSISKKAVLENIASNGLVYTPTIRDKTIVMDSVGIEKQASVFPCLCNYHDSKFFSELDKTEGHDYSMKFFEQLILRTILREFYVLERKIEMNKIVLAEIAAGFENIKSDTINQFNEFLGSKRIKVKDWSDSRFSLLENKKEIQDKINFNKLCIQKLSDFYSVQESNLVTSAIIDSTLPVTFSGLTKFYLNKTQINLVINCLPYKEHTILSIANTAKDDECIKREFLSKYNLKDVSSLLKLIEVLSVYGTDNIFFDMNYWDSLDNNISQKYIQEFSNFERNDPRNDIDFSFLKWDYK
jgi:hypothetical protein